eukprot:jgi/Psemu1/312512/fgenesh1_kg.968_\
MPLGIVISFSAPPAAPPPAQRAVVVISRQQRSSTVQQQEQASIAEALKTSIDNLRFQLGNNAFSDVDVFLHQPPALPNSRPGPMEMNAPTAFVAGDPSQSGTVISALYDEVRQIRIGHPAAG